MGLCVQYINSDKVRFFVWHILAMAHVPLADHNQGLRILEDELEMFEQDSHMSPEARRLYEDMSSLHRFVSIIIIIIYF